MELGEVALLYVHCLHLYRNARNKLDLCESDNWRSGFQWFWVLGQISYFVVCYFALYLDPSCTQNIPRSRLYRRVIFHHLICITSIIGVLESFFFFVEILEVWKLAQHFCEADIIPFFDSLIAKLGEYFREILVFVGYHILGALGHIDIDVWMRRVVPLKLSFFQVLSAMMGSSWLGLHRLIVTTCWR